jgi:hypothetical protein
MTFKSVSQDELPNGRKGKHHTIVLQLLQDIEQMDEEQALKIPTAELPDSIANIRSALNRASRQKNLKIATSSDDLYFYVWKVAPRNGARRT